MEIFTGSGRVGRLRYFGTAVAIGGVQTLSYIAMTDIDPITGAAEVSPMAFVVMAVGGWLTVGNVMQRLHDRGVSGWWWLLTFAPLANLALALYLLFAPGDPMRNAYGLPPGARGEFSAHHQRDRVDHIADAAADLYRAKQADYYNEDGTFNMDGLQQAGVAAKPAPGSADNRPA